MDKFKEENCIDKKIFHQDFTITDKYIKKSYTFTCEYEELWDDTYVILRFLQEANHQLIREVLKKYKNADRIFIKDSTIFGNSSFEDHKLKSLTKVTFENCKFNKLGTYRKISNCKFVNCEFFEVRFDEIEYCKFHNCVFNETHAWDIGEMNNCEFFDCSFIGKKYGYKFPLWLKSCSYHNCKIEKCKMGNNMEHIDFINCNMIDVDFSYAITDYIFVHGGNVQRVFFANLERMKDFYINGFLCIPFNYGNDNFVFIPAFGIVQHNNEYHDSLYPDSSKFEFNVNDFDNFIQKYYVVPKKFRGKTIGEYELHMKYHFVQLLKQQITSLYQKHLELEKGFENN
mgnify:CR=1 FL=1